MSGGGGGGGTPQTPESEIAAKEIELKRYSMADGFNKQYLPQYVSESRRDLSHIARGRANADVMSQFGNQYIGADNPFEASRENNVGANARNTAIIRAHGAAEQNKVERTDSALRAINGSVDSASKGLLTAASRESEEAMNSARNSANTRSASLAAGTSLLGAAGGIAYDQYTRGDKIFGLWGGKKPVSSASTVKQVGKLGRGQYDNLF